MNKTLTNELASAVRQALRKVIAPAMKAKARMTASASVVMRSAFNADVKLHNVYKLECFDKFGNLKWAEEATNLVTTAGLNDLLSKYFKGSSYTASFFVGLVDNASFSAFAAGDTMASHSGWTESVAYSDSARPTLTLGSASAGSIDNSASTATFNINGTATIKGMFITTNSTKSGTTGTLYGEAAFTSGNTRAVESGDTINGTCTLTAATA